MHHKTKSIIGISVSVIVALLIFKFGVFVGYHKARHTLRWQSMYHQNFTNPHAIVGEIITVSTSTLVIVGVDSVEKLVVMTDATIKPDSLKPGSRVVVIGSPTEDGRVEAKIIRALKRTRR
ncbi:MAG: hypothetical protein A2848_01730 [Candidatus Magasanikbacteria bacterium RIFCSPHIGHO2_01_FULL_50_8]|uniref:DUF5666 domain-containing protein n=2 Tax=Candidatus Magasanikiibacteriota TaxID=1752731 RepID=A0A1F6LVM8_9BACT|nr:MAG: hypothetical protein A2848_01730 [Candidatus Magasanikbacteria bacterium RIFCSPHIGHO2_01_FULL_50_8]OGH68231.1 MAG: hypothetical protein A3C15_01250 [Candidatus Magasanikbacteria bacterium RIFCSPHIGHO2_02_FULL_50_9b]